MSQTIDWGSGYVHEIGDARAVVGFGAAPPAATMIVAGLIDPAMRIEIEVTARRSVRLD